ncbi:MAG: NusG domain II-containing protein [Clostridia bacterium]|nr:NusG domain II-containing protein [Clostridia bacterium]
MRFFKKTDIIIILVIIAASLVVWGAYRHATRKEPPRAEIYHYSQLVKIIDLDKGEDLVFSIAEEPDVVFHLYPDGSICFEESDCPDQICVHTGRISAPGQFAACLPNGITMKITTGDDADTPDLVIGGRQED